MQVTEKLEKINPFRASYKFGLMLPNLVIDQSIKEWNNYPGRLDTCIQKTRHSCTPPVENVDTVSAEGIVGLIYYLHTLATMTKMLK